MPRMQGLRNLSELQTPTPPRSTLCLEVAARRGESRPSEILQPYMNATSLGRKTHLDSDAVSHDLGEIGL